MPALKQGHISPTLEEEVIINAGALLDEDNPPLTDSELAQFKPMRGRPVSANPKVAVKVRLDADVLEKLRASGKGWQTRVNNVLRDYVSH